MRPCRSFVRTFGKLLETASTMAPFEQMTAKAIGKWMLTPEGIEKGYLRMDGASVTEYAGVILLPIPSKASYFLRSLTPTLTSETLSPTLPLRARSRRSSDLPMGTNTGCCDRSHPRRSPQPCAQPSISWRHLALHCSEISEKRGLRV